jgi:hypothetical protein
MNFNNVLKSKYLYYAAVALMVINVLGYVSLGSIECVLVLGGAAYLANQFTKNRTVDIFIGLFVSNILFGCGRLKEGMKNGAEKAADACKALSNEAACAANSSCQYENSTCVAKKTAAAQVAGAAVDADKADKKKEDEKAKNQQGFFN